jgi:ABC-type nitrate/sulfonate/bicarbonate transport system permease component
MTAVVHRPPPVAAGHRRSLPRISPLPVVGTLLLVAGWQVLGVRHLLGASFPPLSDVLAELHRSSPVITRAADATFARAAVGGLVGLAVGALLATLALWVPRAEAAVVRLAVLVNAVPVIALGPLLTSTAARPLIPEIFAALAVFFSTLLTLADGYRAVARPSADVFATFGASRLVRLYRLQLPSALPMAADAARLAVPAAVLGAILGEWFGAERGLGVLMVAAMRNLRYPLLWAAALVAVLVSVLGYAVLSAAERWATNRFGRADERAEALPPAPAGGRRPRLPAGLLGAAGLVLGWQVWVWWGNVPAIVAPRPLGVLRALSDHPGQYLSASLHTAGSAVGGLVLGALLGGVLAVAVSLSPWLTGLTSPVVLAVPTIPIVIIVPIVAGWLGYGPGTVLLVCVLMAFFPVFALAVSGLRSRPAGSDALFAVYGAGRLRVLLRLALPAAVPSLLVAMRLSAATTFLGALSAEWLMAQDGLGHQFSANRVLLKTDAAWASVLCAVLLSVATYQLAEWAERWARNRWL